MVASYEELPKEAIRHLYELATIVTMANEVGERKCGLITIPIGWWEAVVLHKIDELNKAMPIGK
jgi:hypothetical protein